MTLDEARARIPRRTLPEFWVGSWERLSRLMSGMDRGRVRQIAVSPGGRPLHLLSFGDYEDVRGGANYNSAAGSGDLGSYMRKKDRLKPVVLLVGPVHGQETEGLTGLMNLVAAVESGSDLRGRPQPELKELCRRCRILVIPCGNPDGLARFEAESLSGMEREDCRFWGQGTWSDGRLCGYPDCKKLHPMKGERSGFLGCYFDDAGVNPMHDEFFAPMGPEAPAMLDVARAEGPDIAISLHSHERPPALLRPAFVSKEAHEGIWRLAESCYSMLEARGLPHAELFGREPEIPASWQALNLTSAIHHVCGAQSATFECPHGLKGQAEASLEGVLDIQLAFLESVLRHALSLRAYP